MKKKQMSKERSIIYLIAVLSGLSFLACRSEQITSNITASSPTPANIEISNAKNAPAFLKFTEAQARVKAAEMLKVDETEREELAVCDAGLHFRVVHIPSFKEVVLSRIDGHVLGVTSLKQDSAAHILHTDKQNVTTESLAIKIARDVFIPYSTELLGTGDEVLDNYYGVACDLGDAWRVSFVLNEERKLRSPDDISKLPNNSPPNFVIEKSSGDVSYFNYLDIK